MKVRVHLFFGPLSYVFNNNALASIPYKGIFAKIYKIHFFPAPFNPKPRPLRRAAYLLKKGTQISMVYESVLF